MIVHCTWCGVEMEMEDAQIEEIFTVEGESWHEYYHDECFDKYLDIEPK